MEYRALDIEINSDEDLKDVYAVVSIHDNTSNQISPIDKIYGPNYKWNFPMKFGPSVLLTRLNDLTIIVELKADKNLASKTLVMFTCPWKNCSTALVNQRIKNVLSYSIISPSGEATGLLYFTYEFSEKFTINRRAVGWRMWILCKK